MPTVTRETRILQSVEAPDSSWWGYSHCEPKKKGRRMAIEQLVPTHVALRGNVPAELLDQRVSISGEHCSCVSDDSSVIIVPVNTEWPAGTIFRNTTLGDWATAYANAG